MYYQTLLKTKSVVPLRLKKDAYKDMQTDSYVVAALPLYVASERARAPRANLLQAVAQPAPAIEDFQGAFGSPAPSDEEPALVLADEADPPDEPVVEIGGAVGGEGGSTCVAVPVLHAVDTGADIEPIEGCCVTARGENITARSVYQARWTITCPNPAHQRCMKSRGVRMDEALYPSCCLSPFFP